MTKITTKNNKYFSFRNQVLYPACIIFTVMLFVFLTGALSAGLNVSETEFDVTEIYDGETGETTVDSSAQSGYALSVEILLGFFLFSVAVTALSLVFRLEYNKILLILIHFAGTVISFFLFVLVLSGFVSNGNLAPAMFVTMLFSILYFVIFGLYRLIKKLSVSIPKNRFTSYITKYIPAVFLGFTVLVFATALYSMIAGELFDLKVIIRINENTQWLDDRIQQITYTAIPTPLAPTIQNYLRYFASSLIFIIAYSLLKTKLNKVMKVLLNFAFLSCGFVLIWLLSMKYFTAIQQNLLIACIAFLSVYVICLIAASIYVYLRTMKREETEEYRNQFRPGKK